LLESIDVDRYRKAAFGCGFKSAPWLVLGTSTVTMTVRFFGEASGAGLQINSVEGSLMIEWE
jgi:hypothetical protein